MIILLQILDKFSLSSLRLISWHKAEMLVHDGIMFSLSQAFEVQVFQCPMAMRTAKKFYLVTVFVPNVGRSCSQRLGRISCKDQSPYDWPPIWLDNIYNLQIVKHLVIILITLKSNKINFCKFEQRMLPARLFLDARTTNGSVSFVHHTDPMQDVMASPHIWSEPLNGDADH